MHPEPPGFPITKLVYLTHRHVVATMPLMDLISYSLICDYSKFIVKSLNIAAQQIVIRIYDTDVKFTVIHSDPRVTRVTLTCYIDSDARRRMKLPIRTDVVFVDCNKPEFSPRDWLLYLMDIFHCKNLEVRFESVLHRKTKTLVKNVFNGLDIEQVHIMDGDEKIHPKILNAFQSINKVALRSSTLAGGLVGTRWSLAIFKTNFKTLDLEVYEETTAAGVNDFIKRWIKAPSSKVKSMEAQLNFYLAILIDLFEGIEHHSTWGESNRSVKRGEDSGLVFTVQNVSGTKATIQFSSVRVPWQEWDRKFYLTFTVLYD